MSDTLPAFEAHGITADYGGTMVLRDLYATLPKGGFTVLLGPNGSGKSTFLRSLARLMPLKAGHVIHDGRAIAAMGSKELARRVGVLAQGPTAPEGLTVRDLVEQGRYPHRSLLGGWTDADRLACDEALHLTTMTDLANRPLDALSGGQRQRAWIAMTLAQQSPTLLLDEPTTFLDVAHQIELLTLLRRLADDRGTSVIAVLHDINQAARYADHMVMLVEGRVIAAGSPEDVLSQGTLRAVFGIETRIFPDPETGRPMCIPLLDQTPPTDGDPA